MALGPPEGVSLDTYALVRATAFIESLHRASSGAPSVVRSQTGDILSVLCEALKQRPDLDAAHAAYPKLRLILRVNAT